MVLPVLHQFAPLYPKYHFHNFSKNRQLRSRWACRGRKTRSCRTQDFCVSPPNPSRSELPAGHFGQSGENWCKMGKMGFTSLGTIFITFLKTGSSDRTALPGGERQGPTAHRKFV